MIQIRVGIAVYNSLNCVIDEIGNVSGDKIKGEKLEKGSSVGIAQRKTLVDTNNFPAQRKMLADISNLSQRNQHGKSKSVLVSKEHVEKLQRVCFECFNI
jgi:hypothetical protein